MRHSSHLHLGTMGAAFLILCTTTTGICGSIVNSKHNLSATGPGNIRALTEDKICIFCHTPHNATPYTPLWNKRIEPKVYILYQSSTLSILPRQPSGPSRLCLSCHDGTIALGDVLKPAAGIDMTTNRLMSGMRSHLDTDISNDHPVSFNYYDALPNPELADVLPAHLHTYGGGNIHCTTCHDPHDDSFGKFLVMDNNYSALCITCHDNKEGWTGSVHAGAAAQWDPPAIEEPMKSVAEYGCEGCHVPHGAGGPERLLRHLREEDNCYPCHNGTVSTKDIEAQFSKISHHPLEATTINITADHHDPAESVTFLQNHVECVDCHNPHAITEQTAEAPDASGAQALVSGRTDSGAVVDPLGKQYELCFKCHGNSGSTPPVIERWISQNDTSLEFSTMNPSYHPVTAMGVNSDVPSIPSSYEPDMTTETMIYCVDCHDSDESEAIGNNGPTGPHGSIFKPILRQQYGVSYTAEYQPENETTYSLCYRCHDRGRLLSDNSIFSTFPHGRHVVQESAPCFICHDPHGVQPDGNGDHTHLINFAVGMVSAGAGYSTPVFNDHGTRAGSCVLICHGINHDGGPGYTYPGGL